MTYTFACPKCAEEITAEVDVGEHIVDWAEQCENSKCMYKFTSGEVDEVYLKALESTWGTMIDCAHDLLSDR